MYERAEISLGQNVGQTIFASDIYARIKWQKSAILTANECLQKKKKDVLGTEEKAREKPAGKIHTYIDLRTYTYAYFIHIRIPLPSVHIGSLQCDRTSVV